MVGASPTEITLYTRAGCGLCAETRVLLDALVVRRSRDGQPPAAIREIDIADDPVLERELFADIPVVEVAGRRLLLATSPARIERLLADALDR